MAQSAGGSNTDGGGGSTEWIHMDIPSKAKDSILKIIDNITNTNDFTDMSDDNDLQFYTGKTKPLVVRAIAQSTAPCLVIVSEPTPTAAFPKEMNTFDRQGTNPDHNGYGTLRLDIPDGYVFNATTAIWSNCKFPDKLHEVLDDPDLIKSRIEGITVKTVYVVLGAESITNGIVASLILCKYSIVYNISSSKVVFGLTKNGVYDMFKYDNLQSFVICDRKEIYALCMSTHVKQDVKIRSMLVYLFPHLQLAYSKKYKDYTFKEAGKIWRMGVPADVDASKSFAMVGIYSLGYCYTKQDMVAGQIARRLLAAANQESIPGTDQATIESAMVNSGFEVDKSRGDIDMIYGWIVALDRSFNYNPEIHTDDLITATEMEASWGWDKVSTAIFTQLRLITQNMRSTSLRFGITGIQGAEQIPNLLTKAMENEMANLKILKEELLNRPYTGLVRMLPLKHQVVTNKAMIYFGLRYYNRGLDEEGKKSFARYEVNAVGGKLDLSLRNRIDKMVDLTAHTGLLNDVELIQDSSLRDAERFFGLLSAENQAVVRRELEKADVPCVWLRSIRQQENDELVIKTKEAIKKKLKQEYETINSQLEAKKRTTRDDALLARLDKAMNDLLSNYGKVVRSFMTHDLEFEPGTSLEMRREMRACAVDFKDLLEGFQELMGDITTNLLV